MLHGTHYTKNKFKKHTKLFIVYLKFKLNWLPVFNWKPMRSSHRWVTISLLSPTIKKNSISGLLWKWYILSYSLLWFNVSYIFFMRRCSWGTCYKGRFLRLTPLEFNKLFWWVYEQVNLVNMTWIPVSFLQPGVSLCTLIQPFRSPEEKLSLTIIPLSGQIQSNHLQNVQPFTGFYCSNLHSGSVLPQTSSISTWGLAINLNFQASFQTYWISNSGGRT